MIVLRYDSTRARAWMVRTSKALALKHPNLVLNWVDSNVAKPSGLDSLFSIEKLLLGRGRASGADIIDRSEIDLPSSDSCTPDVVIDFTDCPRSLTCSASVYLRPLYNGTAGENSALSACLAGDMPVIDIMDEVEGRLIDRGQPSSEDAAGLSGSLDTVMARTTTLLLATLSSVDRPRVTLAAGNTRSDLKDIPSFVLKNLARSVLMRIYHLCCYAPHWHIGWRMTDGDGVWDTLDLSGVPWQRLADPGSSFYADPFAVCWNNRTFVFFEELDHRVGKGVISAIEFGSDGPIGKVQRVLEEAWHLSYPFLIVDEGELWMIPESSLNNDVALYRCVDFPGRWERYATLLTGIELADATVTHHEGLYYLFGVTRDGAGGYSDTLSIYVAEKLTGPWIAHQQNPILVDCASARPAGAFFRRNGSLWRPVQDCSRGYGAALVLAEVQCLSPTDFKQVVRAAIAPSKIWPGRKLHTLNKIGRLEVIDGSRIEPKFKSLFSG